MGRRESGPEMMEEHELEEGEACDYRNDPSIDPDIALSYIGDKVQSILGHLQKDFEGGVSAENLGAKFGGYGSFLPTQLRSPSICSQPKSPQRVKNLSGSRSSDHLFPEAPAPDSTVVSDAPPHKRNGSASLRSMCPTQTLKFSCDDASTTQNASLSSDQTSEAFCRKVELPSSKSVNPIDQQRLKVRNKMGSERMPQYKAAIYDLGLTSPSSSEENSPEETPNESPANILKIMTSFPVSGGLLLSPLCEDLLNLTRETEPSVEHEAARKSSIISIKLLNKDALGGKKTNSVSKNENFVKSKKESLVGPNDCKQKGLESETPESRVQLSHDSYCKTLSDTVNKEKDGQVKNRKESKEKAKGRACSHGLVKDLSLEHTSPNICGKHEQPGCSASSVEKRGEYQVRNSHKDVSVDHGHSSKSTGKKDHASFQAYSDITGGKSIRIALDNSSLEVGTKDTSGEQHELGMTDAGNKLSFEGEKKTKGHQSSGNLASEFTDSLTGGSSAAPKIKFAGKKNVHNRHLSQKDVLDTSSEHVERPFRDRPKNSTLEAAKTKLAYDNRLKEASCKKKLVDKMTSEAYLMKPPAAAAPSNEGIMPGLEQTMAPVVIQEKWVGCDLCGKWRLLPYGAKSEQQLPDQWACSMLDWLPGMNRCEISEGETTNAVQALYLVPVPENHCNFQAPADKSMPGVSLADVHLDQNHQNFASDQVRKQKQKEKVNRVSMRNAGPTSDSQNNVQWWAVKNDSSEEFNYSVAGVNAANKSIVQQPNKSSCVVAKLSKRKEGPEIGDNKNSRKKSKKESVQCVHGRVENMKSKGAVHADNHQIYGQNLGTVGDHLTSGLPNKAAPKDGKKQSARKEAISGGMGNLKIIVKNQTDRMQDLLDNERMGMRTCKGREVSAKKRKFKDYEDRQQQVEASQDGRINLQDRKVATKEVSKDGSFNRDKKSRVTQIEEEFNRSKVDDTSKRNHAEACAALLSSKEYPVNRSIEKEQQLRKSRVKARLTNEDIDKLRKDLGCEQLPIAAASSSSKVPETCKNGISYMELKGSPAESVSSSPARTTYPARVSLMTMKKSLDIDRSSELLPQHSSRKNSSLRSMGKNKTSRCTSDVAENTSTYAEVFNPKNKLKDETNAKNYHAPQYEALSNQRHPLSNESSITSAKDNVRVCSGDIGKHGDNRSENQSTQAERGRNDVKSSALRSMDVAQQNFNKDLMGSSTVQTSNQIEPWNSKLRIDLRRGDKQGAVHSSKYASGDSGLLVSLRGNNMNSRPLDDPVVGGTIKALKDAATACHQNDTDNLNSYGVEQSVAVNENPANKNVPSAAAATALKEAEDLRIHADLIKNSGFDAESNYECFKAALKFLHGASLLEACNGGSGKLLGMNPMQIYVTAAELCKTCAFEYEKGREMAAAALAYKCMEVACLRVVYCKSSTMSRVCHDLKTNQQMVPQGESPSSSASDVDNLNNLALADKAVLSKGNGSHAGNHVIVPHNRSDFVRLLDFTKDVNSAMEAARKSHNMLAAAHVKLEESQNKDGIVSIERVVDFSFQDVEELIRRVWLAFNTIFSQGLGGTDE